MAKLGNETRAGGLARCAALVLCAGVGVAFGASPGEAAGIAGATATTGELLKTALASLSGGAAGNLAIPFIDRFTALLGDFASRPRTNAPNHDLARLVAQAVHDTIGAARSAAPPEAEYANELDRIHSASLEQIETVMAHVPQDAMSESDVVEAIGTPMGGSTTAMKTPAFWTFVVSALEEATRPPAVHSGAGSGMLGIAVDRAPEREKKRAKEAVAFVAVYLHRYCANQVNDQLRSKTEVGQRASIAAVFAYLRTIADTVTSLNATATLTSQEIASLKIAVDTACAAMATTAASNIGADEVFMRTLHEHAKQTEISLRGLGIDTTAMRVGIGQMKDSLESISREMEKGQQKNEEQHRETHRLIRQIDTRQLVRSNDFELLPRDSIIVGDILMQEDRKRTSSNYAWVSRAAMLTARKVDKHSIEKARHVAIAARLDQEWDADVDFEMTAMLTDLTGAGPWGNPVQYERRRIEDAESCFPTYLSLVVSGGYGSGKSEFLHRLQSMCAEALLREPRNARIPLLVDLSEWAPDACPFRDFVDNCMERRYSGRRADGNDLFLLLDEMESRPEALEQQDLQQIGDWIRSHSRAWVAVAVRHVDEIRSTLLDSQFDSRFSLLELEPFGSSQVREFVVKHAKTDAARERLLSLVDETLEGSDESKLEMLGTPMNLSILCERMWQQTALPENEAKLLQLTLRAQFEKEKQSAPKARFEELDAYFGQKAFQIVLDGSGKKVQMPTATNLAYYWRIARLVFGSLAGPDGPHRSQYWNGRMLSYFTGRFLAKNPTELHELLPAPTYEDERRVSRRIDSGVNDLIKLKPKRFGELAKHDPCLASTCFSALPTNVRPSYEALVVDELLGPLSSDDKHAQAAATDALVGLGAVTTKHVKLVFARTDNEYFLRRRIISVLRKIEDQASIELIVQSLVKTHKRVIVAAENAILTFSESMMGKLEASLRSLFQELSTETSKELFNRVAGLTPELNALAQKVVGETFEVAPFVREHAVDASDESTVEAGSGFDLSSAILSTPDNFALVGRSIAWLRRSSADSSSWPTVWTTLWDSRYRTDEMREIGANWLVSSDHTIGQWIQVWIRLNQAQRGDVTLRRLGHSWLDDRRNFGLAPWPFVWKKLMRDNTAGMRLETLGDEWIRSTRVPCNGWGYVWKNSRNRNPLDVDLISIGRTLLEATPFKDQAWGLVWDDLIKNPAFSEDLYQLGLSWISNADDANTGWGYVWPKMWTKGGRQDSQVSSIGYRWLRSAAATHPGWSFVWKHLWEHDSNEDLRQLAKAWLTSENTRSNTGWPWVFGALAKKRSLDGDLADCGLKWLGSEAAATVRGWEEVWSSVWSYRKDGDGQAERRTVYDLGVRWLQTAGLGAVGFSHVWEPLWDAAPDNALRALALDHSWRLPSDKTLMYIWVKLTSSLGPISKQGVSLLRTSVSDDHPQWDRLWLALWQSGLEVADLTQIGIDWLPGALVRRSTSWTQVWKSLWARNPGDERLSEIGLAGLEGQSDVSVWQVVWPALIERYGNSNTKFMQVSNSWLQTSSAAEDQGAWLEVARSLDALRALDQHAEATLKAYRLAQKEYPSQADALWRINAAFKYSNSWLGRWKAMWSPETKPYLIRSGIAWLSAAAKDADQTGFPFVWIKCQESLLERETLIEIGRDWLSSHHVEHNGWGSVYAALLREAPNDRDLVEAGMSCLEPMLLNRGSMQQMWMALLDFAGPVHRPTLLSLGLRWLQTEEVKSTSKGFFSIWMRLWDAEFEREALRRFSGELSATPPAADGWSESIARLFGDQPLEASVRANTERWLLQHPKHPNAESVRALLFSDRVRFPKG